jgi:hypothetical protein
MLVRDEILAVPIAAGLPDHVAWVWESASPGGGELQP